MFNFFKKKEKEEEQDTAFGEGGEEQILADNVIIHTMPQRFRFEYLKVKQAKTTGIFIIGGGILFFLFASVFLYYYFFEIQPNMSESKIKETEEQNKTVPVVQPIIEEKTEIATTTATTTPTLLPETESTASTTVASSTEQSTESGTVIYETSLDTDMDGLSDKEELLLGTNPNNKDSDGDSYEDRSEATKFYNPAGTGRLWENPAIKLYENKAYGYTLLYPNSWTVSNNGGEDSVMFKSADDNFFQVIVQPNTGNQKIEDWYKEQFNTDSIPEGNRVSTKNWYGVKSLDGLNVYLTDINKKFIFTVSYNPRVNKSLDYRTLFYIAVVSLTVK